MLYDSTYMNYLKQTDTQRWKVEQKSVARGGEWRVLSNAYRASVWDDERVWKWMVVVVVHGKCTECYCIIHLKWSKQSILCYLPFATINIIFKKKNEVLIYTTTWMNLKNIIGERSWPQKPHLYDSITYCMIPFTVFCYV